MSRFTKEVEQQGQLVVKCYGLLTGMRRCCILLETLCQIGGAFGMVKLVRRVVFLINGRIGFALQLMLQREEVAKLVEILHHPQGPVARGPVAGHEAQAPIRGHAKAEEMVRLKRFKMPSPGVSRAI